jgi:hypothetical protein
MVTSPAYHAASVVSSLSLPPDELARAGQRLQAALRAAAASTGALGVGTRAALYGWAVQLRAAQALPCGRWYVESCPSYVATVEGCTRWAAAVAWRALGAAVGWVEAPTALARSLGARLRRLVWGSRYGRHLLLEPWQLAALRAVAGAAAAPQGEHRVPAAAALRRLRAGARTATVHCPLHDDRTPSLVLWASGGAQCMACQLEDGPPRWAWLPAGDGQHVRLLPATGASTAGTRTSTAPAPCRYNKSPPMRPAPAPAGPVGGCVARGPVHSGHVTALLRAHTDAAGHTRTWRTPGARAAGGVLAALVRADAASRTQAARDRAHDAALFGAGLPARAVLPDRLLSVSTMGRPPGAGWATPQVPRCQLWVLLDLDDLQLPADTSGLGAALAAVVASDAEASGRCAVVRTGPTGLQVWVELAHARHSAATWHQQPAVRAWHAALGARVLAAAHAHGAQGGHADASACAAGRFGRRPGWRLVDGAPYRAHLLHVTPPPPAAACSPEPPPAGALPPPTGG